MDMLLKKLFEAFGVSGREKDVAYVIKEELKKYSCEIKEDSLGNIIAKAGSGNEKIMLSANMDTKGVIVYHVESDGKIRIRNVGDLKAKFLIGKKVRFKDGIEGEIKTFSKEKTEITDLYVDAGMEKKESVLRYIKEGDTAVLCGNTFGDGENIISPYLSNRIGCYILLKLIEKMQDKNKEIYFVFSTQGCLGNRGARAAAFQIKPDVCFSINTEKEDVVKLGEGPAIVLMEKGLIMNSHVKNALIEAAENNDINIQRCVSDSSSDGGTVHRQVGGIQAGTVAVSCKNKNEMNETVNMKDVENTVKLLLVSINNI